MSEKNNGTFLNSDFEYFASPGNKPLRIENELDPEGKDIQEQQEWFSDLEAFLSFFEEKVSDFENLLDEFIDLPTPESHSGALLVEKYYLRLKDIITEYENHKLYIPFVRAGKSARKKFLDHPQYPELWDKMDGLSERFQNPHFQVKEACEAIGFSPKGSDWKNPNKKARENFPTNGARRFKKSGAQ